VKTAVLNGPAPFKACVVTVPVGTTGKSLVVVLKTSYRAAVTTRTLSFKIR
jgi:hypothetical protein